MPDESVRDFATRLQANWQNAQLGRSCEKDSVVLKFKHFLDNLKPEYSNSCGSPRKSLADLMVITKKGLIALKLKHFFLENSKPENSMRFYCSRFYWFGMINHIRDWVNGSNPIDFYNTAYSHPYSDHTSCTSRFNGP
jgi:hypothetical protein